MPFDLPSSKRSSPEPDVIWPVCFFWFVVALLLGLVSLYFFKHTLINIPSLHILKSDFGDFGLGLLIAKSCPKAGAEPPFYCAQNHFWRAYWFTLGFVMVRFAYASHS